MRRDNMKIFIVVIANEENELSMSKFNEPEHVISAIGQMKNTTVKKIFTVDEYGVVDHYNVIFDGKLKLQEVPKA
jgi:hypothetical protein